jgi:hypothetical protein
MTVRIHQGDCREVLRSLREESVHCVVTSPLSTLFGQRDYGIESRMCRIRERCHGEGAQEFYYQA